MNICGILVHTRPENTPSVRERLETMDGVEVHAATDNGRLVVTVEADDDGTGADYLFSINGVEGVITTSLVYHYRDPIEEEGCHGTQSA